jgi:hypothetical protein
MNKNKQGGNRLINRKGLKGVFNEKGILNISDSVYAVCEKEISELIGVVCLNVFEDMRVKGKKILGEKEFISAFNSVLESEVIGARFKKGKSLK